MDQQLRMSGRWYALCAAMVLLGALSVRVTAATVWQRWLDKRDSLFLFGDSVSYWHLAHCLAADEPYEYGSPDAAVFRVPGYPWLLSWCVDSSKADAGILAARFMGSVFGTLAVATIMLLTAWMFDRAVSLLAGLLAALDPGGVGMSILILSEAPFQWLMILALAALWGAQRAPHRALRFAILSGILSGLAVLIRPSWLLAMPLYYAIRWLAGPRRASIFQQALATGLSMALIMAPWWYRNYQVTGHFVITTLQVGASLYDGWHPAATGGSDTGMVFSQDFAATLRAEDRAAQVPPSNFEYRLDRKLAVAAWEWAQDHPRDVLRLAGKKFVKTWWPWPTAEELPGGPLFRWIVAVPMLLIVIPACTFFVRRTGDWRFLFPFVLPLLYFTLLHLVFVGSVRYRQPAVLVAIVLAAPEIMIHLRSLQRWSRGRRTAGPFLSHDPP